MTTQHTDVPAPIDPRRWKALALLCTAIVVAALGVVAASLLLGGRREPVPGALADPAAA
jgi:hypothetical protein